jgi:acyl carrier protein
MNYADILLAFVQEHLAEHPDQVSSMAQPLISSGIIDSFALVEVATFIEDEFRIVIPDAEMTAANFDTIEQAVATIERFA